jgi:hypothetical protein
MLVLQLLLSVTLWASVSGLIHDLVISDDARPNFFIENFGFVAGGHLVLNVTGFKVSAASSTESRFSWNTLVKRCQKGGKKDFFLTLISGQWTAFRCQLGQGGCGLHHQANRH